MIYNYLPPFYFCSLTMTTLLLVLQSGAEYITLPVVGYCLSIILCSLRFLTDFLHLASTRSLIASWNISESLKEAKTQNTLVSCILDKEYSTYTYHNLSVDMLCAGLLNVYQPLLPAQLLVGLCRHSISLSNSTTYFMDAFLKGKIVSIKLHFSIVLFRWY